MTQAPPSGSQARNDSMSAVSATTARGLGPVPFWFGADALVTGANAVAYLALSVPLVDVLGASRGTHLAVGTFLAVFALYVGAVALASRRAATPRRGAWAAVLVNAAWVVGSVVVAVAALGDYSALGRSWLVAQAVVVGALAVMQARALRTG